MNVTKNTKVVMAMAQQGDSTKKMKVLKVNDSISVYVFMVIFPALTEKNNVISKSYL